MTYCYVAAARLSNKSSGILLRESLADKAYNGIVYNELASSYIGMSIKKDPLTLTSYKYHKMV